MNNKNKKISKRQKKWLENWEYWHKKGKWKYVFTNGIIWGLLTALLGTVFYRVYYQVCENKLFLIFKFLIFIIGGILYAYTMWILNEKRYKKYKTFN